MVGAPFADGQGLTGVDLAPNALRKANLKTVVERLNWKFEDEGDVEPCDITEAEAGVVKATTAVAGAGGSPGGLNDSGITTVSSIDDPPEDSSATTVSGTGSVVEDSTCPYTGNVRNAPVCGENCRRVFEKVHSAAVQNKFVFTVGGDHSIAAGSIAAVLKARPDTAVIWVDAHGDCNTPATSPSGNYHGMPAAHLMGWFEKSVKGFEWMDDCPKLPEARLAFIGLRDLDDMERVMLQRSDVACYSMKDVDRYGIARVMDMALQRIDPDGKRPLHLSLDVDACDPSVAPGTGTKARGGLTYREVHYICETMADTERLRSMDLVEINPALDPTDAETMHGDDPDVTGTQTVRLGIELAASALGKNIL